MADVIVAGPVIFREFPRPRMNRIVEKGGAGEEAELRVEIMLLLPFKTSAADFNGIVKKLFVVVDRIQPLRGDDPDHPVPVLHLRKRLFPDGGVYDAVVRDQQPQIAFGDPRSHESDRHDDLVGTVAVPDIVVGAAGAEDGRIQRRGVHHLRRRQRKRFFIYAVDVEHGVERFEVGIFQLFGRFRIFAVKLRDMQRFVFQIVRVYGKVFHFLDLSISFTDCDFIIQGRVPLARK